MSLFRYFGEQGQEHKGTLFWSEANPGHYPLRSPIAPLLTREELMELTQISGDYYVEEFDLTNEQQKQRYCEIMTRAYNGWYAVIYVERQGTQRIVEWVQRYNELSPQAGHIMGLETQGDKDAFEFRALSGDAIPGAKGL